MITTIQNSKVQRVRQLIAQRKEREAQGAFVVEGVRLMEEARNANWQPEVVLFNAELSKRGMELVKDFQRMKIEVVEVSAEIMTRIADTDSPQGIMAIIPVKDLPFPREINFLLVLDQVRDPGNLGATLRTAEAAGVQGVVLTPGTVDAFSPKVMRAGMGAQFRIPLKQMGWEEIQETYKPRLKFYLADAEAETSCWKAEMRSPLALIIGGEAEGVSASALQIADELVSIPMPGKAESLNASAAASILIFEVVRQRLS
jgi:TrmH family RNA methyltransferase